MAPHPQRPVPQPTRKGDLGAAIPEFVLAICRRLQQAGFPCVLVGGAVRDLLRGRRPVDWDLATGARPEDVQRIFRRVVPTGIRFGTVTVLDYGVPCEVTSFRIEGRYEDGRRPEWVKTGVSLEEDLSRRDFTINAIAFDPVSGTVIDPFGGRQDLEAGVIRAVGVAEHRFQEDALRILRAVRIMSEEGFTLHPETKRAMAAQGPGLQRISGEREGQEMVRLLMGDHVVDALLVMARTHLVSVLWPQFAPAVTLIQGYAYNRQSVYMHTARTVGHAVKRLPVRLAAFGHDWGKVTTRTPDGRYPGHHQASVELFGPVLKRWHLPNRLQTYVLALVRHHMFGLVEDKTLRRWIAHYGVQWVLDLIDLREADALGTDNGPVYQSVPELRARALAIIQEEPVLTPNDLALNGRDIMRLLQIPPGPEVGRWKERLYQYVLEDPSRNTADTLRRYLMEAQEG